jgi:hypothetical protein
MSRLSTRLARLQREEEKAQEWLEVLKKLEDQGHVEPWRAEIIRLTASVYLGRDKVDYLLRALAWIQLHGVADACT